MKRIFWILLGCTTLLLTACGTTYEIPPGYDEGWTGEVTASGRASIESTETASFEKMVEHGSYHADGKGHVYGYGEVGKVDENWMADTERKIDEVGEDWSDALAGR
ncbi:MAG: hypothetical protein R3Y07_09760 [Eubacteriales bacterium]